MALAVHTGVIAFSSKNAILNATYTGQYRGQWVYANDTEEYFYVKTSGELSGALPTLESNGGLAIKIDNSGEFALQITDHQNKPIIKLLYGYDLEVYGAAVYKGNKNNFGNNHNDTDNYVVDNAGVFSVDATVTDSHIDIVFDVVLTSDVQDILTEIKGVIPGLNSGVPRLLVLTALGRFTDTSVQVSDIYDEFDIAGAVSISWVIIEQNGDKYPALRLTNTAGNVGNTTLSNIKIYKGFYKNSTGSSTPRIKDIYTHNNTPNS